MLQKNLLKIKKKFPNNRKKIFKLDKKYNMFSNENLLVSFSTLIFKLMLVKIAHYPALICQKLITAALLGEKKTVLMNSLIKQMVKPVPAQHT